MELDINTDWVNYSYFTPTTPTAPARRPTAPSAGVDDGDAGALLRALVGTDFVTMSARTNLTKG